MAHMEFRNEGDTNKEATSDDDLSKHTGGSSGNSRGFKNNINLAFHLENNVRSIIMS